MASDKSADVIWREITSADLFFFFHDTKSFKKPSEFLFIKQIDNIFPCVCTVIDHRRRHKRVKNNSHATRLRLVSYFSVLYILWHHVIYYRTHARKNCYVFVKYISCIAVFKLCWWSRQSKPEILFTTHFRKRTKCTCITTY